VAGRHAEPPFDDVAPFGGGPIEDADEPRAAGRRAVASPAGERRGDPAERQEHARALAWRALNRRERTELELRGLLAEKRVAPEDAAVVLGELLEGGFVDDARFARQYAEDRRRLDAWGSERIERRLRELGVAREHIAAALEREDEEPSELESALAILRRRFPDPPQTTRERDRALGMLVRKGYSLELAYDALRRHAGIDEVFD
jgi:regulatory protein